MVEARSFNNMNSTSFFVVLDLSLFLCFRWTFCRYVPLIFFTVQQYG